MWEIFLLHDFNSCNGKQESSDTVGKYREETFNNNGERLITIGKQNSLKIRNGFYLTISVLKAKMLLPYRQSKLKNRINKREKIQCNSSRTTQLTNALQKKIIEKITIT